MSAFRWYRPDAGVKCPVFTCKDTPQRRINEPAHNQAFHAITHPKRPHKMFLIENKLCLVVPLLPAPNPLGPTGGNRWNRPGSAPGGLDGEAKPSAERTARSERGATSGPCARSRRPCVGCAFARSPCTVVIAH